MAVSNRQNRLMISSSKLPHDQTNRFHRASLTSTKVDMESEKEIFVELGLEKKREKEKERERENKAGYTAIQSRTVGQEQYRKNRSEFRNVTDGPTDLPTDLPTNTAMCRVACPRLKTNHLRTN